MKDFRNTEAEKILINQMLLDPSIIPNVYDTVKPDTFSSQTYKSCYNHILDLQQKCTPIDFVSFHTEATDISIDVINEVTSATYTANNWLYFANLVKNCYISRNVRELLQISLEELSESNGNETVNNLLQKLSMVSANTTSCQVHNVTELVANCMVKLDDAIKRKSAYTGIPSGISNLDEITMGIQKELIYIGARPSLGKTALAEQMALYTAGAFGGEGIKTGFIELEMSADQLIERGIANIAKIGINKLRSGLLTTDQLKKIMFKAEQLSQNKNFVPITCNSRNISDIVSCVRREVRNNGMKIVFIDHIGLIHPDGTYRDSWQGVREISNTLQQLQRELKIPIIILSQVGRESEGKENNLASLRGSGAIEEDADTVIFIERDRQKDQNETTIPARLNVVKNRNGACGSAEVEFHPREVMFTNVAQSNDRDERGSAPNMNFKKQMETDKNVRDFLGLDENQF